MKKKWYKSLILTVLAVTLVSSCGCEGVFESTDKGDGIVKDISDGLYILDAQGNYYQPSTDCQTFEDMVDTADSSRIVYSVNGTNNIPTLYSDDKLVMYSADEIPDSLNVERFSSIGWTLGLYNLQPATGGGVKLTSDCLVPNSDAYNKLSAVLGKSKAVTIYSIDGKEITTSYPLSKASSFEQMEEGETHTLGVYAGTYYKEINITADTKLWSSSMTTTTAGYTRTKSNYIEINIGGLEDGYYNFNGTGLVKVVRKENRPAEK